MSEHDHEANLPTAPATAQPPPTGYDPQDGPALTDSATAPQAGQVPEPAPPQQAAAVWSGVTQPVTGEPAVAWQGHGQAVPGTAAAWNGPSQPAPGEAAGWGEASGWAGPTQPAPGTAAVAPAGGWGLPPGGQLPPPGIGALPPQLGAGGYPGPGRPRRSRGGLLLGLATTIFVVAAAVFGTLYLTERSSHDRTRQESASQLAGVQRELATIKGKLSSSEQNEDYQRDRIADLENRNTALKECVDAVGKLLEAENQEEFDDALRLLVKAC